jgi:hypothetical protein
MVANPRRTLCWYPIPYYRGGKHNPNGSCQPFSAQAMGADIIYTLKTMKHQR